MDEAFKTTDLNIAVTLIASELKMIGVERKEEKSIFIFNHTPELRRIIDDFWDDKLQISPRKIFDTQRMLKARLYSTSI